MVDDSSRNALALVRALYHATDGVPRWWILPRELNQATRSAIDRAFDRGWMLIEGDYYSVCLTDAGRELVKANDA